MKEHASDPASERRMADVEERCRPFEELQSGTGLLWLINRAVFHPRGFALSIWVNEEGEAEGWELEAGSEHEPFRYADEEAEDRSFLRLEAFLFDVRNLGFPAAIQRAKERAVS